MHGSVGIGIYGLYGGGVTVKGIIPPEDEVPLREKFPLPLEVVLDKGGHLKGGIHCCATIGAAGGGEGGGG